MDVGKSSRGVTFAPGVWHAMLADARLDLAVERCGLLLGMRDADVDTVTEFRPTANVAANPARHFEIDPAALIAAWREKREGGLALLGHYHSHPSGVAEPSATDLADAYADGRLWVIVTADDARAWWCVGEGEGKIFIAAQVSR